ncbi:MAG TPA: gamma-glutamyl-gamma-aminobutyrate hydrolase family protein, partial [Puia sp.]|nr:gamma-glutamyl-gamma-aminobutyrate hydrolase family protein [Puia sp.]
MTKETTLNRQRLRIGLTYTGSDKKHDNYARWIQDGDGSIEVIKIEAGGEDSGDLDALVLSGGVDIAPEFYSGSNVYAHAPAGWERARDLFELEALERALKQRLPVFGVCRGLQLINVALGGSLVQDLGEGGDAVHEGTAGADKQHEVRVEQGSLLASVVGASGAGPASGGHLAGHASGGHLADPASDGHLADHASDGRLAGLASGGNPGGTIRGLVNSAHHQAIARLAEGLRVNCRAEDGTIEGVEWTQPEGRSFLLAVQWHPERMYVNGFADAAFYKVLRDRFIK